jgi:alcohol dehydrogenase
VKAVYIERHGDNSAVRIGDRPLGPLGPDDLLVDVRAASVNPVDFKIRDGQIKALIKYPMPLVLGNDLAGVVAEVGAGVTRFKVGDEIFARLDKDRIGAFAERALVRESAAAKKPPNITHEEAASLPLVGLTSWQALVDIAKLEAGQKVLIHAGSGGVGTFAIQLAKYLGAFVATTASEKNAELVKSLGADRVVDYKNERFDEVLADYDVVFDTIGDETQHRSFSVLKRGGRMVSVGGKPDAAFGKAWGMNPLLVVALRVMMRKTTRLAREHDVAFTYLFMKADGAELAKIGELVERGVIRPVIDRTFSLDETKEALAYSESGRARGKVVIRI